MSKLLEMNCLKQQVESRPLLPVEMVVLLSYLPLHHQQVFQHLVAVARRVVHQEQI
jgi:hypothetical protein